MFIPQSHGVLAPVLKAEENTHHKAVRINLDPAGYDVLAHLAQSRRGSAIPTSSRGSGRGHGHGLPEGYPRLTWVSEERQGEAIAGYRVG
jgi:hypothetical protein